jgi:DNA-binding transcriptional regulator YhcF (GntR family)
VNVTVQKDSPTANRIAVRMKKDLVNFNVGDRFTSLREAAKKYETNAMVASVALRILIDDGLLSVNADGFFVSIPSSKGK